MITELNERSRNIFRHIVDAYLETGNPVGSKMLSHTPGLALSPATIRSVMAELEAHGLLYAPHTSAGRLPTQGGLRLYIDGLMEIGNLTQEDRAQIDAACEASRQSAPRLLEKAGNLLSGLSAGAGLVVAPKTDKPLRQIQFVQLDPGRILAVLVMKDGMVENRVIEVDAPLPPASLTSAANYLSDRLAGKTIAEARTQIMREIDENKTQLDRITASLVKRGLALQPDENGPSGHIIIRGQSKLLEDVKALDEIERARALFDALEEQETMAKLLATTQNADGVQIFIGTENSMFEHAGWSMVLSPYKNQDSKIIGAIGVIGPTRLNYGRVIPIVDYTAQVMGKLVSSL